MNPETLQYAQQWADCLAILIDQMESDVVRLMRNHASIKAAGPSHTIQQVERLALSMLGADWRSLTTERSRRAA